MKLVLIILSVLILDYGTKVYIQQTMTEGMSIPIIENIFHITFIFNRGAAFGILENQRWVFVLAAIILLFLFVKTYKKIIMQPFIFQLGIALTVGGAIGNLIDRVTLGQVVDFLDFRIWPIFNVADIAISIGAGCVLWVVLTNRDLDW